MADEIQKATEDLKILLQALEAVNQTAEGAAKIKPVISEIGGKEGLDAYKSIADSPDAEVYLSQLNSMIKAHEQINKLIQEQIQLTKAVTMSTPATPVQRSGQNWWENVEPAPEPVQAPSRPAPVRVTRSSSEPAILPVDHKDSTQYALINSGAMPPLRRSVGTRPQGTSDTESIIKYILENPYLLATPADTYDEATTKKIINLQQLVAEASQGRSNRSKKAQIGSQFRSLFPVAKESTFRTLQGSVGDRPAGVDSLEKIMQYVSKNPEQFAAVSENTHTEETVQRLNSFLEGLARSRSGRADTATRVQTVLDFRKLFPKDSSKVAVQDSRAVLIDTIKSVFSHIGMADMPAIQNLPEANDQYIMDLLKDSIERVGVVNPDTGRVNVAHLNATPTPSRLIRIIRGLGKVIKQAITRRSVSLSEVDASDVSAEVMPVMHDVDFAGSETGGEDSLVRDLGVTIFKPIGNSGGGTVYARSSRFANSKAQQSLRNSIRGNTENLEETQDKVGSAQGTEVTGYDAPSVFPVPSVQSISERIKAQREQINEEIIAGKFKEVQIGGRIYRLPESLANRQVAIARAAHAMSKDTTLVGRRARTDKQGGIGIYGAASIQDEAVNLHAAAMLEHYLSNPEEPIESSLDSHFMREVVTQELDIDQPKDTNTQNALRLYAQRSTEALQSSADFAYENAAAATNPAGYHAQIGIANSAMQQKAFIEKILSDETSREERGRMLDIPKRVLAPVAQKKRDKVEEKTIKDLMSQGHSRESARKLVTGFVEQTLTPEEQLSVTPAEQYSLQDLLRFDKENAKTVEVEGKYEPLTIDQALTYIYGTDIAAVPKFEDASIGIRRYATRLSKRLASKGIARPFRPYKTKSTFGKIIGTATNEGMYDSLKEEISKESSLEDQLRYAGNGTLERSYFGRSPNMSQPLMIEQGIYDTIDSFFGLDGEKDAGLLGTVNYARQLVGNNGQLKNRRQIAGVYDYFKDPEGISPKDALGSLFGGAEDFRSLTDTSLPIIEYAKLATKDSRSTYEQDALNAVQERNPIFTQFTGDQLKQLTQINTSESPKEVIRQIIAVIGKHVQELIKKTIAEKLTDESDSSKQADTTFRKLIKDNDRGVLPKDPQYRELFKALNFFDLSKFDSDSGINNAFGLIDQVIGEQTNGMNQLDFFSSVMKNDIPKPVIPNEFSSETTNAVLEIGRTTAEQEAGRATAVSAVRRKADYGEEYDSNQQYAESLIQKSRSADVEERKKALQIIALHRAVAKQKGKDPAFWASTGLIGEEEGFKGDHVARGAQFLNYAALQEQAAAGDLSAQEEITRIDKERDAVRTQAAALQDTPRFQYNPILGERTYSTVSSSGRALLQETPYSGQVKTANMQGEFGQDVYETGTDMNLLIHSIETADIETTTPRSSKNYIDEILTKNPGLREIVARTNRDLNLIGNEDAESDYFPVDLNDVSPGGDSEQIDNIILQLLDRREQIKQKADKDLAQTEIPTLSAGAESLVGKQLGQMSDDAYSRLHINPAGAVLNRDTFRKLDAERKDILNRRNPMAGRVLSEAEKRRLDQVTRKLIKHTTTKMAMDPNFATPTGNGLPQLLDIVSTMSEDKEGVEPAYETTKLLAALTPEEKIFLNNFDLSDKKARQAAQEQGTVNVRKLLGSINFKHPAIKKLLSYNSTVSMGEESTRRGDTTSSRRPRQAATRSLRQLASDALAVKEADDLGAIVEPAKPKVSPLDISDEPESTTLEAIKRTIARIGTLDLDTDEGLTRAEAIPGLVSSEEAIIGPLSMKERKRRVKQFLAKQKAALSAPTITETPESIGVTSSYDRDLEQSRQLAMIEGKPENELTPYEKEIRRPEIREALNERLRRAEEITAPVAPAPKAEKPKRTRTKREKPVKEVTPPPAEIVKVPEPEPAPIVVAPPPTSTEVPMTREERIARARDYEKTLLQKLINSPEGKEQSEFFNDDALITEEGLAAAESIMGVDKFYSGTKRPMSKQKRKDRAKHYANRKVSNTDEFLAWNGFPSVYTGMSEEALIRVEEYLARTATKPEPIVEPVALPESTALARVPSTALARVLTAALATVPPSTALATVPSSTALARVVTTALATVPASTALATVPSSTALAKVITTALATVPKTPAPATPATTAPSATTTALAVVPKTPAPSTAAAPATPTVPPATTALAVVPKTPTPATPAPKAPIITPPPAAATASTVPLLTGPTASAPLITFSGAPTAPIVLPTVPPVTVTPRAPRAPRASKPAPAPVVPFSGILTPFTMPVLPPTPTATPRAPRAPRAPKPPPAPIVPFSGAPTAPFPTITVPPVAPATGPAGTSPSTAPSGGGITAPGATITVTGGTVTITGSTVTGGTGGTGGAGGSGTGGTGGTGGGGGGSGGGGGFRRSNLTDMIFGQMDILSDRTKDVIRAAPDEPARIALVQAARDRYAKLQQKALQTQIDYGSPSMILNPTVPGLVAGLDTSKNPLQDLNTMTEAVLQDQIASAVERDRIENDPTLSAADRKLELAALDASDRELNDFAAVLKKVTEDLNRFQQAVRVPNTAFGNTSGRSGGGGGGPTIRTASGKVLSEADVLALSDLESKRNLYASFQGNLPNFGSRFDSQLDLTRRTRRFADATLSQLPAVDLTGVDFMGDVAKETAANAAAAQLQDAIAQIKPNTLETRPIEELAVDLSRVNEAAIQLNNVIEGAGNIDAAQSGIQNVVTATGFAERQQARSGAEIDKQSASNARNLEENMQAIVSQPGLIRRLTGGVQREGAAHVREYLKGVFGDSPEGRKATETMFYKDQMIAYDNQGRRRNIVGASAEELQNLQARVKSESGMDVSIDDLQRVQRAMARVQQARNQSPFNDILSYSMSRVRDLETLGQTAMSMMNAPQTIASTISQIGDPQLRNERIMTTARALSLSPETYTKALAAATQQQSRFGGTLARNLEDMTSFIPISNTYGVDVGKSVQVARKLAAFDPAQGMQGASIALKEFLSGNVSSLSRRFEINRSDLSKINTGDANEMLDSLDILLAKMGVTDKLIDDQANSLATKYDRMTGRLETMQVSFSAFAVSAMTPLLEPILGDKSFLAKGALDQNLQKVVTERLKSYGDSVLSNPETGLKTVDVFSSNFMQQLDPLLAEANASTSAAALDFTAATGNVSNVELYRRMGNMNASDRRRIQQSTQMSMLMGMNKEPALLKAMRDVGGDFFSGEEYLAQRRPLGFYGPALNPMQRSGLTQRADKAMQFGQRGQQVQLLYQVDADTYDVRLPSGKIDRVRLAGVDAPEKITNEGKQAISFARRVIGTDVNDPKSAKKFATMYTQGVRDQYGRLVGSVSVNGHDLGTSLIASGNAAVYDYEGSYGQDIMAPLSALERNAANTGIGPVNAQAARLGLGANAEISQAVRDKYFWNTYLGQAGLLAGVGGAGASTVIGAINATRMLGAAGAFLTGGGAATGVASVAALPWIAGLAATAGATYLGYSAYVDSKDTSAPKMRELQRLQSEEDMRKEAGIYGDIVYPQAARDNRVERQRELDAMAGSTGAGSSGVLGAMAQNYFSETDSQKAREEFVTQYIDSGKELAKYYNGLSQDQKKVYALVVNDPITKQRTSVFKAVQMYQTLIYRDATKTDATAKKLLDENQTKYDDLSSRIYDAMQASSLIDTAQEYGIRTTYQASYDGKGPPRSSRYMNSVTSVMDPQQFIDLNTDQRASVTKQLSDAINTPSWKRFAKEYADQAMEKQAAMSQQRFTQFVDSTALNSLAGMNPGQLNNSVFGPVRNRTGRTSERVVDSEGNSISPLVAPSIRALELTKFAEGVNYDESGKENLKNAQAEAVKTLEQQIVAYREQEELTRPFNLALKGTYSHFIQTLQNSSSEYNNIMTYLSQGNPRGFLDISQQMSGFNQQSIMQNRITTQNAAVMGIGNLTAMGTSGPTPTGRSFNYGYTAGPQGTLQYARDFMRAPERSLFNPAAIESVIMQGVQANTEIIQRNIQFGRQMRDADINNRRAIEDINRNGMRSLEDIHRTYTRNMIQLAQQSETSKRLGTAQFYTTAVAANIDPSEKARITASREQGQQKASHIEQADVGTYLKTTAGQQDTELQDAYAAYQAIPWTNYAEKETSWKKVMELVGARKAAAEARMNNATTPPERSKAQEEFGLLSNNYDRGQQYRKYVDDMYNQQIEFAGRRKQLGINRVDLEREGVRLREKAPELALQLGKARTPEEIKAARNAIEDNNVAIQKNSEALAQNARELESVTITAPLWADNWREAGKNILESSSSTISGLLNNLEDFNISYARNLEDAYRGFKTAKEDMIRQFTDAATEIAQSVPAEFAGALSAITSYQRMSLKAEAYYNSGNVEAAQSVQKLANYNLAGSLYPKGSEEYQAMVNQLNSNVTSMTAEGMKKNDLSMGPSGLGAYGEVGPDGKYVLRVVVKEVKQIVQATPPTGKDEIVTPTGNQ